MSTPPTAPDGRKSGALCTRPLQQLRVQRLVGQSADRDDGKVDPGGQHRGPMLADRTMTGALDHHLRAAPEQRGQAIVCRDRVGDAIAIPLKQSFRRRHPAGPDQAIQPGERRRKLARQGLKQRRGDPAAADHAEPFEHLRLLRRGLGNGPIAVR